MVEKGQRAPTLQEQQHRFYLQRSNSLQSPARSLQCLRWVECPSCPQTRDHLSLQSHLHMLTWTTGSRRPSPRQATLPLLHLQGEVMEGDPPSQTTHLSPLQRVLDTGESTAIHLLHLLLLQGSGTATWATC